MANKSRKKKLSDQAHAYAQHRVDNNTPWENAYHGFNDGYRAGMHDLRKILHDLKRRAGDSPVLRELIIQAVEQHLRPLR